MKIVTGLFPKALAVTVPVRENVMQINRPESSTVIPLPHLRSEVVWIITFQQVWRYMDGEVDFGDVLETMLASTEPHIEQKSFSLMIPDEHPNRQELVNYELRRYQAPNDVVHDTTSDEMQLATTHKYSWWEVTI